MGLGISYSQTDVTFKQNQFFPGEQMRVILSCDNTKCKVDVKNFKFKFIRTVVSRDASTGHNSIKETQIFAFKEPGCLAHKTAKREFVFDVPLSCQDDEEMALLPGSWLGQIFSVEYVMKVFVKHSAWNSVGQGSCIELPIKVLASPQLIQADENFRVPTDWRPI